MFAAAVGTLLLLTQGLEKSFSKMISSLVNTKINIECCGKYDMAVVPLLQILFGDSFQE